MARFGKTIPANVMDEACRLAFEDAQQVGEPLPTRLPDVLPSDLARLLGGFPRVDSGFELIVPPRSDT